MFWDSSALVPLVVPERPSSYLASLLQSDPKVTIWWGSPIECQSAMYRRHREERLAERLLTQALAQLEILLAGADTVPATEKVRTRAGRLLALHPLRAADALQLAAALVWCGEQPTRETLVCLDERLRLAALREGFSVLPEF